MNARRILVVSLVVAAVAASSAVAALSPAQYRSDAASICKTSKRAIAALGSPRSGPQIKRFLEQTLPIGVRYTASLRALDPPASLAAPHKRLLAIVVQEVDLVRAVVAKIHAGADPLQAFNASSAKGTRLGNAENAQWRILGVKACVS